MKEKGGKRLPRSPTGDRKPLNKIDKMLALVGILVVAFIVAMIAVFCVHGAVPDSLVVGVFGLAGGECGILGIIKSAKERRRERQYQMEDREYNEKHNKEDETCSG